MTQYSAILLIIISIIVFLLLREFFCWYLKINKSIARQEELSSKIDRLVNNSYAIYKLIEVHADTEKLSRLEKENIELKTAGTPDVNNTGGISKEHIGTCPSCGAAVDMNAQKCNACDAIFKGRHAKWKPTKHI